jgi:hypothetical protein
VHDLYFDSKYEEFRPRTIWSLSNAFTSAFKELDPIPQFSMLYGVGVYDAPTLATVVLTLVLVTLLAITLPTLKIAKIDPANTWPIHYERNRTGLSTTTTEVGLRQPKVRLVRLDESWTVWLRIFQPVTCHRKISVAR